MKEEAKEEAEEAMKEEAAAEASKKRKKEPPVTEEEDYHLSSRGPSHVPSVALAPNYACLQNQVIPHRLDGHLAAKIGVNQTGAVGLYQTGYNEKSDAERQEVLEVLGARDRRQAQPARVTNGATSHSTCSMHHAGGGRRLVDRVASRGRYDPGRPAHQPDPSAHTSLTKPLKNSTEGSSPPSPPPPKMATRRPERGAATNAISCYRNVSPNCAKVAATGLIGAAQTNVLLVLRTIGLASAARAPSTEAHLGLAFSMLDELARTRAQSTRQALLRKPSDTASRLDDPRPRFYRPHHHHCRPRPRRPLRDLLCHLPLHQLAKTMLAGLSLAIKREAVEARTGALPYSRGRLEHAYRLFLLLF